MTLAEIRRLAEETLKSNQAFDRWHERELALARAVLRLLTVAEAAKEYRALWLHVHEPETGGEPTIEERVRLGYVRGELFEQIAALEAEG